MENTLTSHPKWHFVNNFWLKLIALLTMTADHIGLMLLENVLTVDSPIYQCLRAFGRLALPLFAFMIAEGVKHTKHFGKYILRLGIMATAVSIALEFIYRVMEEGYSNPNSLAACGNIYIDLLLGAIGAYCILHKKWQIKLLSLLPLGYGILSSVVRGLEVSEVGFIAWFPYLIRTQYWFYGIAMIMAFALMEPLKNKLLEFIESLAGASKDSFKGTNYDSNLINILNCFVVIFMTLILYVVNKLCPGFVSLDVQTFAILSGFIILFYNGKRGYNKKWFQYGCYLYYPFHILVLFLIFTLLGLY